MCLFFLQAVPANTHSHSPNILTVIVPYKPGFGGRRLPHILDKLVGAKVLSRRSRWSVAISELVSRNKDI